MPATPASRPPQLQSQTSPGIAPGRPAAASGPGQAHKKPSLNMSDAAPANPQQWLNFSLPPRQRQVPGSGGQHGVPRRSRKGEGWRSSALSRERYVHANFRFMLKPNEMGSYGAHFADPDMYASPS